MISQEIEDLVKSCPVCVKVTPPREPLLQSSLPDFLWERVETDLFELKGEKYLVVVSYYSRYMEVEKLKSMKSTSDVTVLKELFSQHGVPSTIK